MNEQAIDVVGVEDLAMVVDGREDLVRPVGDLGLDKQLLARQTLYGAAHPLEGAVALRAIEVGDALIIGISDESVESFLPQAVLDIAAVAARAETQIGRAHV